MIAKTVGYIGLGTMGAPMLHRLAKDAPGGSVFGYDAKLETTNRVCQATGAGACRSIAEIAGLCDILFTCLPSNDVVRSVYLGDGGVLSAARSGTTTIDCSTIGPEISREIYHKARETAVQHLDASMLGSVAQAEDGSISFVIGGDKDAVEFALPALEKVGSLIRHCGGSGTGNQMKLLHQALVAGHVVAVAETLALCQELGADIDIFYDVVTKGTGFAYSRYFEKRVPRICQGEYSPLFMLKFMAKDARLAREMIPVAKRDSSRNLQLLDAAIATLEEGENRGLGEEDVSAATKVLQARFAQDA
ncbi:MAG: NAD(P)-dependent oxidoreductase [Hyphomicrobiaceae bacterium]